MTSVGMKYCSNEYANIYDSDRKYVVTICLNSRFAQFLFLSWASVFDYVIKA